MRSGRAAPMAKITAANLDSAIKDILEEYSGTLVDDLDEVTVKVAKAGAQALKSSSNEMFKDIHMKKGRYGSGWAVQTEKTRLSATGIIYNRKYPGLPHLLEHGHALRGGGRWKPSKEHIKPIEDEIIESFEKEVDGVIGR